jgi:hypothetical protein
VTKDETHCPQRVGKKGDFCGLMSAPSVIHFGIVFGETDPPLIAETRR